MGATKTTSPSGVGVIVTTYRQPDSLCLVLRALTRQTVLPDEVLVVDDGSDEATLLALKQLRTRCELPFKLLHVWQPDQGFRLSRNLNNGIFHASSQSLAFLDQDTLPHAAWLQHYMSKLRPGRVCLGRVLRLTRDQAAKLTVESVMQGTFEQWHDPAELQRLQKLQQRNLFYAWVRRLGMAIRNRPSLGSGNVAAWRPDLFRINGYDEEYVGWGQQDDDLGRRLYKSGVQPVPLIDKALVSHIYHPYRHAEWKQGANVERYRRRIVSCHCRAGLDSHPHKDVQVTEIR